MAIKISGSTIVDDSRQLVNVGTSTVSASSNLHVGAGITMYGNSGIVSATSFYGSGANITGLTASQIPDLAASKITSGTFATARIADDAVTTDKLADAINTAIDANTAKVTNATHTGDVTGSAALTIANDKIEEKHINAGGTAGADKVLVYDSSEATNWKWATQSGGGGGASGLWASNTTGINTSTNVGIGTTTASAMLEIGSVGVATANTVINAQAWDGQVFNVDGNITSDSIFSVNDISGLPVIDFNATSGKLALAPFGGQVSIGYTNAGTKLGLKGSTSERAYVSAGSSLSHVASDRIYIDDGNVQYYSVPETGGTLTPDITSNNTLNADLAIGDSVTVVVIVKPDSADDKITNITIDGSAATEEWLGGSAPTGGANGTYDVYTFFILKTADATFLPLCNKVNYA